jgi:hypothetical protein
MINASHTDLALFCRRLLDLDRVAYLLTSLVGNNESNDLTGTALGKSFAFLVPERELDLAFGVPTVRNFLELGIYYTNILF